MHYNRENDHMWHTLFQASISAYSHSLEATNISHLLGTRMSVYRSTVDEESRDDIRSEILTTLILNCNLISDHSVENIRYVTNKLLIYDRLP